MSWKSFACLAAVAAMTAPAVAQTPTIALVDNGGGNASLNITTSVAGAVGAEIQVVLDGGLTLGTVTENLTDFIANPGDNPFIAGSPVGGDTTGLYTDGNNIFAAFGSTATNAPAGTYELFNFDFTGSGLGDASGVVAQLGDLGEVLMDLDVALDAGGGNPIDLNMDGFVDDADLGILLGNWGSDSLGDLNNDMIIDDADLGILLGGWMPPSSLAVPEPTSVVLFFAGLSFVAVRKRS